MDEEPALAAGAGADDEPAALPRRRPLLLWLRGRVLSGVDPEPLERAERGLQRRYQDRARWRIR